MTILDIGLICHQPPGVGRHSAKRHKNALSFIAPLSIWQRDVEIHGFAYKSVKNQVGETKSKLILTGPAHCAAPGLDSSSGQGTNKDQQTRTRSSPLWSFFKKLRL